MKSNNTNTKLMTILVVLKILIPFPSPDQADTINNTVAIARMINWKLNVSGVRNKNANPLRICAEPNTSVEAITITVDRKSTRLNSSHVTNSYSVDCLKEKKECT